MPFTKLQFKPGIVREVTSYTNEGGWHDCDKVRFQKGYPEKIGGWQKQSTRSFLGTCRALHTWVTLSLDQLIGLGTNLKYYINQGGDYADITPLRETTAVGAVTFTATTGSARLLVADTNHGAVINDFVTFSGAVSLGGNITAGVLNQEYQITEIVNTNSYYVEARLAGTTIGDITVDGQMVPTPVLANSSDVGNGGAAVVAAYQINTGLDTSIRGSGWGAGPWSRGGWGSSSTAALDSNTLRIWTHDNFGEDLLINVRDGGIYYWDATNTLSSRAVNIANIPGAKSAPTIARQVLVSDRDRHIIAFGCDPQGTPGIQDPLTIRFSDSESATDWAATATNSAGEIRLGSGSGIIAAVETRQQILVFTDTTLYGMQFLGPPFTFGAAALSENITVAGPNAAVAVDDTVFWMGRTEFYIYDGAVQRLPCMVREFIFNHLNQGQIEKVNAALNTEDSEIWWFYPSEDSSEVDRYVVYNYLEQVWYFGNMGRTAWEDRGIFDFPIAANTDGYLYEHEIGFDDGTTNPASPINAFIQSSPMDLEDGDNFVYMRRMIPDVSFLNSTNALPEVDLTMNVRNVPDGTYFDSTTSTFVSTQAATVNQRTEIIYFRLRGRQMSFRIASDQTGTTWRLGSPRLELRSDGRR